MKNYIFFFCCLILLQTFSNSYSQYYKESNFWQFESHTSLGYGFEFDKSQKNQNYWDMFFCNMTNSSYMSFNYVFLKNYGISLKLEGQGANFSISMNNIVIDNKLSKEYIMEKNEKYHSLVGVGPNIGLNYYFEPQSFNYMRVGFMISTFFGPNKISDNYYYDQVGWFMGPTFEFKYGIIKDILYFESYIGYSRTNFYVGNLAASTLSDKVNLKEVPGNLFWFGTNLRVRPWKNAIGFNLSARNINGKADNLPSFNIIILGGGVELFLTTEDIF